MAIASDIREWFLLREAAARADSMPKEAHATFHVAVLRAHQKREAAEALWAYGARAEALALAVAAVELVHGAAEAAGEGALPSAVLTAAGEARAKAVPVPALDADLSAAHEAVFRKLLEAHASLDQALLPVALDRKERRLVSGTRIGGTLLLFLTILVGAVWLARRPVQLHAEASASLSARHTPANVTDGADATEWVLPDQTPGFIDLSPLKPRPFKRLRVLNGKNGGNPDRAVLDADIEIWSSGKVIKTVPVNLGPFALKPDWRRIDLGTGATPIEKVRIVVKTWAGVSGAISEAVLE